MPVKTFWVDPVDGDDGDDGELFVDAVKTINQGLTNLVANATVGDTLNLVNTGTHDWPLSASEVDLANHAGTSWAVPGATIQGVTSTGAAAMVTIAPAVSGAKRMVRIVDTSQYIVFQNLIWDASSQTADVAAYNAIRANGNNAGPIRVRYCSMIGAATGSVSAARRALYDTGVPPNNSFELLYVYFQNVDTPMGDNGYQGATMIASMDHCIGIWDNTGLGANAWYHQGNLSTNANHAFTFTNCTMYEDAGTNLADTVILIAPTSAATMGTATCHSNLIWRDTTGTVNPLMGGSATLGTYTGVIDSNVLLGGSNVSAGDLTTFGWYRGMWDANADDATPPDTYPLDTVVFGETDSDVFNDPTTSFAWELPNGLTTTILKDLRPKKYRTAGRFGAAPGALPAVAGDDTGGGGGDPDDPATIPFLDVRPFFAPVKEYAINARLSTERNRVQQFYVRRDREDKGFREWTGRRIPVAPSSSVRVHSGVETADLVFTDSDNEVELNVGKVEDIYLPAAKQVLVAGGEYSFIKLNNTSSTNTATTLLSAVD